MDSSEKRPISKDSSLAKQDKEAAVRALDELVSFARKYRTSKSYQELMHFIARFRFYSPFNAMLIHIQRPGAEFVAPAHRWLNEYNRRIKPNAQPLLILQPMGPVMFVFDVSDTEPLAIDSPPLPPEVENPFEVSKGRIGQELDRLIENAKRDGVKVWYAKHGSQSAGFIRKIPPLLIEYQNFLMGYDNNKIPIYENVRVTYELVVNTSQSPEAKYATIVHELAHLYCGHLGSPNPRWWADRRGLDKTTVEFEAESVTYLVCSRLGIDNPSDRYLSNYLKAENDIPKISLDCVLKTAGLIEKMSRERMRLRD